MNATDNNRVNEVRQEITFWIREECVLFSRTAQVGCIDAAAANLVQRTREFFVFAHLVLDCDFELGEHPHVWFFLVGSSCALIVLSDWVAALNIFPRQPGTDGFRWCQD